MSIFDLDYVESDHQFVAGVDEVGRGPLAGPVVAATAFLEVKELGELRPLFNQLNEMGITDSKKLTTKKRIQILKQLGISIPELRAGEKYCLKNENSFSLYFSIAEISPALIDEINILNASLRGMSESFKKCYSSGGGTLLIDGNKTPKDLPHTIASETVVKGDSKSTLIALASIIAKEYRDFLMVELSKEFPGYGLEKHAGYPTKAHKEAIIKLGVTSIHRKSFKGVKEYL